MNLAKIENSYSKNILAKIVPDNSKVATTSGTATYDYLDNNLFGSKSLRVNCTSYKTADLSFNFGTDLETPIIIDGVYFFSFFVQTDENITLEVSLTGSRTGTETFEVEVGSNTKYFQRFTQSKLLENGEDFNVSFKLIQDATHPTNNIDFLIDGLKLELNSGLGLPENFTKPENAFGWERMLDIINTQTITADTDTKITFNNSLLSSGGLSFIDVATSKINPIQLLDVLKIDFTFSFPSPAGTNDFVKIYLKVGAEIYRANSFNILEPTSETNFISVNFSLPVESDFLINGAELFVKSSVGITISNKYLFVQRTYKSE
jgi:hypothetical protein